MKKIDLLELKDTFINEIEVLLNEITGIQIEHLKDPDSDDFPNEIIDKDFERLERLLDLVYKINAELEERGK